MTEEMFTKIFKRFNKTAVWYAKMFVGEKFCEDIAQEVFLKFYNSYDDTYNLSAIRKWFWVSIKNTSINFLKQEKTRLSIEQTVTDLELLYNDDNFEILPELMDKILKAKKNLPFARKRIVEMRLSGISFLETASLLKINVNTVRVQWSRFLDEINSNRDKDKKNKLHYYNGEWKTGFQWSEYLEVDYKYLMKQLSRGWSIERFINHTREANKEYISYNGQFKTLREWSKELGFKWILLYDRIYNSKWSIKKAFETPVGG